MPNSPIAVGDKVEVSYQWLPGNEKQLGEATKIAVH